MGEEDFPKEVTKDNIDNLRQKVDRIRKKTKQWRYKLGYVISYLILGLLALLSLLYIAFWIVSTYLPEFPSLMFVIFVPTVLFIWSYPTLGLILDVVSCLQRKYFGYPKYEEEFFAKCFIIARHLKDNERMKAMKEVGDFVSFLNTFVKDRFNPKRKVYEPEINSLINAEDKICRMLMFSEKEIPELLMNLGLAFVRNDNPDAFSYLNQLIHEVREYRIKPRGRIRSFLAEIELYPTLFKSAISILVFVVPIILAILGIPSK